MQRGTRELSGVMETVCIFIRLQVLQERMHLSKLIEPCA